MRPEVLVGWDVGGAHLKAACVDTAGRLRWVRQLPCALWRGLDRLQRAVARLREEHPELVRARHALTMTGELVDLFPDRKAGVVRIVAAMQAELADPGLRVYAGAEGLVAAAQAVDHSAAVASANWLASAAWAAARLGDGLLLDIGSTTTDIVPFSAGRVCNRGGDDFERMRCEELVYTGVVRTPVGNLAERVPFEGEWIGLAAEHFSTAADVHRLTGELPEGADQQPTPDRASRSLPDSARRLARMIGRDLDSADMAQWRELAAYLAEEQLGRILRASWRVLSRGELPAKAPVLGAGVGRFLAARIAQRLQRPYRDFGELCGAADAQLGPQAADCAPAVALAHLALSGLREEPHGTVDRKASIS